MHREAAAGRAERPYQLAGGVAVLNAKKPLNTFAADLSPILRGSFSSTQQLTNKEIISRAYVSTDEVTEYDRVLESLLRERSSHRNTSIVQGLRPTRRGEKRMARAISKFGDDRPEEGELQIIQGAVGSGKSLFIRRFKEVLQPANQVSQTFWTFVDFNGAPPSLDNPEAQKWLCGRFIASFEEENPRIDLTAPEVLRGIFSRNIQRRRAIYEDVRLNSPEQAALLRASDLAKWQEDPLLFVEGLCSYVLGGRDEILVAVMDNVDKLELKNQLDAFQLALWLLSISRAFVVIQMRDETYERYKNRPPLDTFRSNIAFHIAPLASLMLSSGGWNLESHTSPKVLPTRKCTPWTTGSELRFRSLTSESFFMPYTGKCLEATGTYRAFWSPSRASTSERHSTCSQTSSPPDISARPVLPPLFGEGTSSQLQKLSS